MFKEFELANAINALILNAVDNDERNCGEFVLDLNELNVVKLACSQDDARHLLNVMEKANTIAAINGSRLTEYLNFAKASNLRFYESRGGRLVKAEMPSGALTIKNYGNARVLITTLDYYAEFSLPLITDFMQIKTMIILKSNTMYETTNHLKLKFINCFVLRLDNKNDLI